MRMPWSRSGAREASTHFVKVRVRVQGRTEQPDIGKLRLRKQTSGTSCAEEGWRHGNMHLLDLSWQTSPWTWSETWPVWSWASWTSVAWLSGSADADLKSDATTHPSSEQWSNGCRTRILFREEGPPRWPPSSAEYLLLVLTPEPTRDQPQWKRSRWNEAEEN